MVRAMRQRATRLDGIPGIGVDRVGDRANASGRDLLRLENLDTDLAPMSVAVDLTRDAVSDDAANSYLPFPGHLSLRAAAAAHVGAIDGNTYDPLTQCVSVAGGLNGIFNALLATVDPGREVVICDPIYAGLVNRIVLAGGRPRFVSARPGPDGWHVDPAELAAAIGPDTAAALTMSPAMPTGLVLGQEHWDAIAGPVERFGSWIIHDAAMERLRFDGRAPSSPAGHPALADATITVGSASKELRMIGWRVGWVVGPASIMSDIALVGMANVVCQVGIAQQAVAGVLGHPDLAADIAAATGVWSERAQVIVRELDGVVPVVPPHGGWSVMVDSEPLDVTPLELSDRLFERGGVAATPMNGWGPSGHRYLRLVFANEPVERLVGLRDRFLAALR